MSESVTPDTGSGVPPETVEVPVENGEPSPLPPESEPTDVAETSPGDQKETVAEEQESEASPAVQADELPPPGGTAPHPVPPSSRGDGEGALPQPGPSYNPTGHSGGLRFGVDTGGQLPPLTINQLAIVASSQNKLPVNKAKGIVLRVGRPTESSMQKTGRWYKSDNYVDKNTYTWKNMPLFEDYQRHLWTPEGTVRTSCKK